MVGLEKFFDGFQSFRKNQYHHHRDLYRHLAEHGQSPKAIVISCVDSRVDPVTLTQADPGDLFIVRNVANLVPPFDQSGGFHGVGAALEFAIKALAIPHIIILGHAHCGGIAHVRKSVEQEAENKPGETEETGDDFLTSWTHIARPAVVHTLNQQKQDNDSETCQQACELAGIEASLDNLLTFPWIAERVEAGKLDLHGWHFDMGEGALRVWDAGKREFGLV